MPVNANENLCELIREDCVHACIAMLYVTWPHLVGLDDINRTVPLQWCTVVQAPHLLCGCVVLYRYMCSCPPQHHMQCSVYVRCGVQQCYWYYYARVLELKQKQEPEAELKKCQRKTG